SAAVGPGPHDPAGLALAARGILVQHDARVLDALPRIRVPTLVVVGEHDRPFPAAADLMAAKIPGAEKVVLPGAGPGERRVSAHAGASSTARSARRVV
ncbi:alpha/beta hydrolase, partial [Candidatus Binatia bacterium]|nr:alpha/beta hydrolase [Candidatus Binatia bacterium]